MKRLLTWFFFVSFSLMFTKNTTAQSEKNLLDLLQGQWWYRSLQTSLNFDMEAQTTTFFPYNIYFSIKKDTCEMITLRDKGETYHYDTTQYIVKVEDAHLLFFSFDKKKEEHRLKINSIKNQSLTLEDREGAKINPSLFLRNAKFVYTFSRHSDFYKSSFNVQRELKGDWYCRLPLLQSIKSDSVIELSAIPIPMPDSSQTGKKLPVNTIYKVIKISDEEIEIRDSLTLMKRNKDEPLLGLTPRDHVLGEVGPVYYIVPAKKLIEIELTENSGKVDRYKMPVFEKRRFLFTYNRNKDQLVLKRIHQ